MDVAEIIVEELNENGALRRCRMRTERWDRVEVAFANEYEGARSGPFHFFEERHEHAFQRAFAECEGVKLSSARFNHIQGDFFLEMAGPSISTKHGKRSYYALCLPEFAIPDFVEFRAVVSEQKYKKTVVRDDHRNRFALYLECRSSDSSFRFIVEVHFKIAPELFANAEYSDETTTPDSCLPSKQQSVVQQFFAKELTMGDQYNVSGQAGAVGPNANAMDSTFNQVWNQASVGIDLSALASELSTLRSAMRKEAVEVEHDQAIAHIAAAESAAKSQDGGSALRNLKAAGKWALDAAEKLGVSVAAKAIEKAIGM